MSGQTAKHHDRLIEEDVPLPSERSTGLVFAVVFLVLALVFRADMTWGLTALTISAAFAAVAFLAPGLLAPFNRAWFAFALLLNRFVSPVIMFVIYGLAIVPFGLALQMRADPLRRKKNRDGQTYWIDRTQTSQGSSMRDQF